MLNCGTTYSLPTLTNYNEQNSLILPGVLLPFSFKYFPIFQWTKSLLLVGRRVGVHVGSRWYTVISVGVHVPDYISYATEISR